MDCYKGIESCNEGCYVFSPFFFGGGLSDRKSEIFKCLLHVPTTQWIHEGPFRPQNSFLDQSAPVFQQPCKDVGDFKECQIAAINGGCVNEPYKYTGPRERERGAHSFTCILPVLRSFTCTRIIDFSRRTRWEQGALSSVLCSCGRGPLCPQGGRYNLTASRVKRRILVFPWAAILSALAPEWSCTCSDSFQTYSPLCYDLSKTAPGLVGKGIQVRRWLFYFLFFKRNKEKRRA